MKLHKIVFFALALILVSCNNKGKKKNNENPIKTTINKIEVIDFHSTHRCITCNAIEANTKYTLDTYFEEELLNGIITFQTVNVDEEKNYSMAEKFEASGTALFINVISNGIETKIDITDFAFMKGKEQEVFSNELKMKIETELNKL